MNRTEHLLTVLGEECAEVQQRVSKALRFGLDEVEPGQALPNRDRIVKELHDLFAVVEMLQERAILHACDGFLLDITGREEANHKHAKVSKYLDYSRVLGTLQ